MFSDQYIPTILSTNSPIPLRTFLTCAATTAQLKETREMAMREIIDPFCRQIYIAMREYINPILQSNPDVIRIEANFCTTKPDSLHFYIYKTHTIPNEMESIELDFHDFDSLKYDPMALGHYLIDAYGFQKDSSDVLARNICFSTSVPLAPLN